MRRLLTSALLFAAVCTTVKFAKAQDINNDPGAYMTAITNAENNMNKAYMEYISAAAHSGHKSKIDKMREQAVNSIVTCQSTISGMQGFKGDNSYKQSCLNYIQLCYKIFNEDYAHIVNMEDISERSYDAMQAYLLLQEATNDTLKAGNERISKAAAVFAAKYHVNLVSQQTELVEKMRIANNVSKYHNKIYLLFFKCNWEDSQLTDAVNQKNVTKIEQMRSALDKYAIEGLAVLDTMHNYENDPSMIATCKQALTFYKQESESAIPTVTDFFLKGEGFDKLKASMDAKAANQRTQQDVNTYNKAVAERNAAVSTYNQTNVNLNTNRNMLIKNWMDTEKQFTDTHTPYYN